jgi:aspartyl-tRNA(Asn)/glutamyl-tRNA(Gln) amidotransferase subunit B
MTFESVIGLEVHAQLKTRTKIFCGCSTRFGAPPNQHTCPVCLGMPGVLPVLNRKVVEYTLRMALATRCEIAPSSRFARKNYFYPDLPKGYQISQYELPIARNGHIDITHDDRPLRIGINRIHMEEDAGKLNHDPRRPVSLVDYNRTGVPLIEIVSEPDLRLPEQAGAYLRKLRTIVRYLDICDGNMEEGSFRCDANVSIRPRGLSELGTRTELKNLNSFRFVEKALQYEIDRQIALVSDGGRVVQETRLWDAGRNRTISMRGKEEAHDYRYFPDPDLLPLDIDDQWVAAVQSDLPELPDARRRRYMETFGLSTADADMLTASREVAEFFEACQDHYNAPKSTANWIMGELMGLLNAKGLSIDRSPVSARDLARILELQDQGVISGKIAKTVFEETARTGQPPETIIDAKGLVQVSDRAAIEAVVAQVLEDCPEEVAAYRGGKSKLIGFFVGQVMKATRGKANPQLVNQILRNQLDADA